MPNTEKNLSYCSTQGPVQDSPNKDFVICCHAPFRRQLPSRIFGRDPLSSFIALPSNSVIDEALATLDSPKPTQPTKLRLTPRRSSLLTARQANELLLDNFDCLSEKIQGNCFSLHDDFEEDSESDLEE